VLQKGQWVWKAEVWKNAKWGGGWLNEWQTGDGPAIEAVFCRVGLSSAGNLDSQVPI